MTFHVQFSQSVSTGGEALRSSRHPTRHFLQHLQRVNWRVVKQNLQVLIHFTFDIKCLWKVRIFYEFLQDINVIIVRQIWLKKKWYYFEKLNSNSQKEIRISTSFHTSLNDSQISLRRRAVTMYNHIFIMKHISIYYHYMRYQNEFNINKISAKINFYFLSDNRDMIIYFRYDIMIRHR